MSEHLCRQDEGHIASRQMVDAAQNQADDIVDWVRHHLPDVPLTPWQEWFLGHYMRGELEDNWYFPNHGPARRRRMHMAYSARLRARRRR